jgi:hypothetical protein
MIPDEKKLEEERAEETDRQSEAHLERYGY